MAGDRVSGIRTVMTPQQHSLVGELFLEVKKYPPPDVSAFLFERCPDDEAVRKKVEEMFLTDLRHGERLETPAMGPLFDVEHASMQPPPGTINGYEILDVLGRGGMGVVYRARQANPDRLVALKVMRPEIISTRMIERFDLETQLLGRLQHPGIAQIFEAGTIPDNPPTPFFVMEFVEGIHILEFARLQTLTQKLNLFIGICNAVQHAHAKSIIHRDLKPSNILVTKEGRTKILDFGIARTIDSQVQAATLDINVQQIVGTIPYMSPEQIVGDEQSLDTRTDVYSLGVILHEILTGEIPYVLAEKPLTECIRIITDRNPTQPSHYNSECHGDLDRITSKALQKNPETRYPSAAAIADDVCRFLNHEPITARRQSFSYQLTKMAARHRIAVSAIAFAILVTVAGFTLSTIGFVIANGEREKAQSARSLAQTQLVRAESAEADAVRQADIAQAVNEFLNDDLLAVAGPQYSDPTVTIREVLDRASRQLDKRFNDQPSVKLELHMTLGRTYSDIGEYDIANAHLEAAAALLQQIPTPDDAVFVRLLRRRSLLLLNTAHYDEALALTDEAIEILETQPDKKTIRLLNARRIRGRILRHLGRFDESGEILESVVSQLTELIGSETVTTQRALRDLAALYARRSEHKKATRILRSSKVFWERELGFTHPVVYSIMNSLGHSLTKLGKLDEAETVLNEALNSETRLGVTHRISLAVRGNLAMLYETQGRYEQAEPLMRELIELRRNMLQVTHPDTITSMNDLATLYISKNNNSDAIQLLRDAATAIEESQYDVDHLRLTVYGNLASALTAMGDLEAAEPILQESLDAHEAQYGSGHTKTLTCQYNLAALQERRGEYNNASDLYERTAVGMAKALSPDHWRVGIIRTGVGRCLYRLDRYTDAESVLLDSYTILENALGRDHPMTRVGVECLVELYERWDRPNDAESWRSRLIQD
jgi:eukaryotic-like serine/threonine-protein kinase